MKLLNEIKLTSKFISDHLIFSTYETSDEEFCTLNLSKIWDNLKGKSNLYNKT